MTYFYLTSESDPRRPVARPNEPQLVPAPLPEDWQDGDPLPEPIADPRPDEERVLDGYPGHTVAFALDRAPEADELIDEDLQAIVPNLDVLRARKIDETMGRMQQAFLAGFTVPAGTMAGSVLQLRNDEDRTNWLSSAHVYASMIAAGNGAAEQAVFRTAANETLTVSFDEGHLVLLQMQGWGAAIMACSWRLKDAIAAAQDADTIAAIDVEAETWPS